MNDLSLSVVIETTLDESGEDIKCRLLYSDLENHVSNKIDSWSRNKISRKHRKQKFHNNFKLVYLF